MECKRITCPESAHLEEIDFERTPLGIVIAGCSRFEPRSAVQCECECARRMDRREQRHVDDREERVLVVYADAQWTRAASSALAKELVRDRMTVELADADRGAPPPYDYDAVVVGTPLRFGRYARSAREYIAEHRVALSQMPAFLFVVHRTDAIDAERFARTTGWRPTFSIGIERPPWRVRWFGDPVGHRAARVHELAQAVADQTPGVS